MKKIMISIFVFFLLVISLFYFCTIKNDVDQNNIYYIFSTSAQTLAALVGFVLTAYIFTYQNLRSFKEDDETLTEIVEITIESYYNYIFRLSSYTAIVLIADILLLQLNMIETWSFKSLVYVGIAMANVFGIIIAFAIALYILRPFREKDWALSILNDKNEKEKMKGKEKEEKQEEQEEQEKLNESVTNVNNTAISGLGSTITFKNTIKTIDFIEKYIELERIIREYTDKKFEFNERTALRKRIDYLGATQILSPSDIGELLVVIKYRNLAVHGHITEIDLKVYNDLVNLLEIVKEKLKN